MNARNSLKGLIFVALWFVAGRYVASWTDDRFWMASMGGVFEPPATWRIARDLGILVLPPILVLGGLPAGYKIARGRPWKQVAIYSFAISALIWLIFWVLVWWGPELFGWYW